MTKGKTMTEKPTHSLIDIARMANVEPKEAWAVLAGGTTENLHLAEVIEREFNIPIKWTLFHEVSRHRKGVGKWVADYLGCATLHVQRIINHGSVLRDRLKYRMVEFSGIDPVLWDRSNMGDNWMVKQVKATTPPALPRLAILKAAASPGAWLPFTLGDWLGDPRMIGMSSGAKGVVVDLLAIIEQEARGTRHADPVPGAPRLAYNPDRLARLLRLSKEEFSGYWEEIQNPDKPIFQCDGQFVWFGRSDDQPAA